MKKFLLSTLFLSLGANGMAAENSVSLERLKEICAESTQGTQSMNFSSAFHCNEVRDTHVVAGTGRVAYKTGDKVQFQINMKDLVSKRTHGQGATQNHEETCQAVDRWKVTVRHSETITSCEDLNRIETEKGYCEAKLAPKWAEYERDVADGSFSSSSSVAYDAEKVGPTQTCAAESSDDSSSENAYGSSDSSGSVSSSDLDYNLVGGANFVVVTEDRGYGHHSHKVVELTSNPQPESLLYKMGMRTGDQISEVGGKRTRKPSELIDALRKANKQKNKQVKVDFKAKGGAGFNKTVKAFG